MRELSLYRLMSEKQFSAQVKGVAEALGWTVYRTWTSIHSPAGFPDLTMVRPPRLVFVELKTMKGKTPPPQDLWLDRLRESGVEVYLWRPDEIDAIEELLR